MSQLNPDQIAAYDQLQAHFGPRIEMTITALQYALLSDLSVEDAFQASARSFYDSMPDAIVLASLAAVLAVKMAQERNDREARDA